MNKSLLKALMQSGGKGLEKLRGAASGDTAKALKMGATEGLKYGTVGGLGILAGAGLGDVGMRKLAKEDLSEEEFAMLEMLLDRRGEK